MTGMTFGRLTALEKVSTSGKAKWRCRCQCGNECVVYAYNLSDGHTLSCGCYKLDRTRETNTKHGLTQHTLYKTWVQIKVRCFDKTRDAYPDYGGRGITMCKEWCEDFMPFFEWSIRNGWEEGLSIDRIDNDGNYEPNNCRWVTMKVQQNNTSRNHYLTYKGKTQTMIQWCEEVGLPYHTVMARINKLGWDIEKALSTPVRGKHENL